MRDYRAEIEAEGQARAEAYVEAGHLLRKFREVRRPGSTPPFWTEQEAEAWAATVRCINRFELPLDIDIVFQIADQITD